MTTRLQFHAAAGIDPGRVHQTNQDNTLVLSRTPGEGDPAGLYVVADGMGGHQAGEVASKLAVDTIKQELAWLLRSASSDETEPSLPAISADFPRDIRQQTKAWVRRAIERANQVIFEYARDNPMDAGNLGTTVTCALLQDDYAVIANVGDSRTYLLRNGTLRQVTEDHSYVAKLVREGQIEPAELYTHPRRNVITRSLGHRAEIEVDSWLRELEAGDRLLLCSDGLWEMVQDEDILTSFLLDADDPAVSVRDLIDAANEVGGRDNIGVIVVHVEGVEDPAAAS